MTDTPTETDAELMERYRIKCVPTDRFHYKSFRYSDLASALAQAKRDEAAARS